jgi:Protein of unknown function (DUF3300)
MRRSGNEEDIVPSLQTLRARLAGVSGGAFVATLCALLAAPAGAVQEAPATAPAQAAAPAESVKLSADQLDSLVAPIALYPDPLLAQCLVAATYPIDIVAAQQWLAKNTTLKGEELVKAAEQQPWDPSVQALVTLPDALKVLSENIKWTQDLGDAFLAQQSDVMDAVQRLRAKAKEGGKLESTEQQKVETKVVEQKTVIEIQPSSTEVVYVPSYSPTVIWGPPVYPYPPMYYPPYYPGAGLIGFGVGIAVGIGISGGWGWGCGWGGNNDITINNNNNFNRNSNRQNNVNRSGNSNWQHNAQQRGGAPYKDKATASKYGGGTRGDSASSRQAQAGQRQAQSRDRGGASSRPSTSSFDRGGSSSFDRGGSSSRGSSSVGSRDFSSSSRGSGSRSSSGFSGSSSSGSRARASSSRGSSSMGGMRGGGGGRRR